MGLASTLAEVHEAVQVLLRLTSGWLPRRRLGARCWWASALPVGQARAESRRNERTGTPHSSLCFLTSLCALHCVGLVIS